MKKYLLFLFCIAAYAAVGAQESKVMDNLSLKSNILNMERKYAVYLPAGYETSQRYYPVLYLLHGGGDDQTGWIQFGEVQHIADSAIKAGGTTAMIIIMPDASATRRGFYNNATNTWRYEDFFFQEFIPFIEKSYRIKAEKRFRAVAGLSMGGDGTFTYALHHPEMFSSACPFSAGGSPLTMEDARTQLTKETPDISPANILAFFNRQNFVYMINAMPDSTKKTVRWFIGCGDDDFQYEASSLVHIAMKKRDIPHEFRIADGGHNWTYWRGMLPLALDFVSQGFHQH